MKRVARLRGRFGGELLLLGWPGPRRYRAREAAGSLHQRCPAGSANAADLIALASGYGNSLHSLEDAIEIVADLVEDGSLMLLELDPADASGAGRVVNAGANGGLDWDNLRRLADLRESDPTVTFGWLSIELVDHTGVPFRDCELKLRHGSGSVDRIVLDAHGKWRTRSIEKTGTCKLIFSAPLRLGAEQRAAGIPDGFRAAPEDLRVTADAPGDLSLPRYDTHYRIVVGPSSGATPQDPAAPTRGQEAAGRWSVTFVLDDGAPLAGATAEVSPPKGAECTVELDRDGNFSLDDVLPGQGRVRLAALHAPRVQAGADGHVASPHRVAFPFGDPAALELPAPSVRTVVVRRPRVARVDPASLLFARESSLLTPLEPGRSHLAAVATAIARCCERPGTALLVVGHASADGDAASNDALAMRRASGVRHILAGDRDQWVALAATHGTPGDIQRLLGYLAQTHRWPTDPGRADGVVDDAYSQAIQSFQSYYNAIYDATLDVDGVCGEQTIGALFDTQSYELAQHLAILGASTAAMRMFSPPAIGAGANVLAHPALLESREAAGQRRIDLLLIDDTVAWRDAHGIALLYDSARFETLAVGRLPLGLGDLVMRVVDHYGRPLASTPYELITDVERRAGQTDIQGLVVELGLAGELLRLRCGAARAVPVDLRYQALGQARFARPVAQDEPDDDPFEADDAQDEDSDADWDARWDELDSDEEVDIEFEFDPADPDDDDDDDNDDDDGGNGEDSS